MLATIDWSQLWGSNVEMLAVITGVICVALITFEHKSKALAWWNWPIGIVSSAAFVYVFWNKELYFNSALQVFYVVTGFWGAWIWRWGEKTEEYRPIHHMLFAWWGSLVVLSAVVGLGLAASFGFLGVQSAAPFWDAWVVTLSLTAQFLLTFKVKENWHFWMLVDIIGVFLFASQGLWLTSALYFVYGCLVVRGEITWHKQWVEEMGGDV
jgi:nicotinamide mononucleotide transporter